MKYRSGDLVKSCKRLESGLRLGPDSIHACCMGAFLSPAYWTAEEAAQTIFTKDLIIEKRRWLFEMLNRDDTEISCKHCDWVETKPFQEVCFHRLGVVDMAHSTVCDLRCNYCGYTQTDNFHAARYNPLSLLKQFQKEDVEWDAFVDLNGGEPALFKDLDRYLEFFGSIGIRIILYTNAVRFHPSIYQGLANGTVHWVVSSLDAGTPSTFRKMKGKDVYLQVLENLTRYAFAGNQGTGVLAIKYIFNEDNCSEDDIAGFTYAMLAIRPQKVYLTFDFSPLGENKHYDYSRHIDAYLKMYLLLQKHGLEAVPFFMVHPTILQRGRFIIEEVQRGMEKASKVQDTDLYLPDFRKPLPSLPQEYESFDYPPLRLRLPGQDPEPWSIEWKKVLLAPACKWTKELLEEPEIRKSEILGFLDRNQSLHHKEIEGFGIFGYEQIPNLHPDVILVASPKEHRGDILKTLRQLNDGSIQIAVLDRSLP